MRLHSFVLVNVCFIYCNISYSSYFFSSGYAKSKQNCIYFNCPLKDHLIIIVGILCLFGSCLLLYIQRQSRLVPLLLPKNTL